MEVAGADAKQRSRIDSWYNLAASVAVPELTVSPVRCGWSPRR